MARKYLVTEGELTSATVTPGGDLTFTRDNGQVVNAGSVTGDSVPALVAAAADAVTAAGAAATDATRAESAAARAEAVPVTNDGIMASVAADDESAFATQLSAKIAALIEAGVPPLIAEALGNLDPELLEPAIEAAIAGMSIYSMRGVLTAGTDLDTLSAPTAFGVYQLTSGGSYPNRPSGTSGVAILEVFGSANAVIQRLSHTGVGYDWTRNKLSSGSWSAWTPSMASRGALPTGTNIATLTGVTHSGLYRLSAANTYIGVPAAIAGTEATLEVQYISTSVVHRISAAGSLWQRFFQGGWAEWRRFTSEAVFVGPTSPESNVPAGAEYAWIRTDGNGTFVDILVGKKAA